MLWEAHYNTTMYNKYKKYCTIHNTDTVAYATHSGYYIIFIIIIIVISKAHQGHKG